MSQTADRVRAPEPGPRPRRQGGASFTIVPALPARREIRVAVVSPHQLTRAGLTELLSSARVGTAEMALPAGPLPDVVVYELTSSDGTIPDDLGDLLAVGVPVVALISLWDAPLEETVLAMGVAGLVRVDTDADGLLQVLQRVASGRTTTLMDHRTHRRDLARADADLTAREMSILELVGAGLANQDIADRLFISINTVKTYIRSAYRKIGVTRRPEAVMWAFRHDLTPR